MQSFDNSNDIIQKSDSEADIPVPTKSQQTQPSSSDKENFVDDLHVYLPSSSSKPSRYIPLECSTPQVEQPVVIEHIDRMEKSPHSMKISARFESTEDSATLIQQHVTTPTAKPNNDSLETAVVAKPNLRREPTYCNESLTENIIDDRESMKRRPDMRSLSLDSGDPRALAPMGSEKGLSTETVNDIALDCTPAPMGPERQSTFVKRNTTPIKLLAALVRETAADRLAYGANDPELINDPDATSRTLARTGSEGKHLRTGSISSRASSQLGSFHRSSSKGSLLGGHTRSIKFSAAELQEQREETERMAKETAEREAQEEERRLQRGKAPSYGFSSIKAGLSLSDFRLSLKRYTAVTPSATTTTKPVVPVPYYMAATTDAELSKDTADRIASNKPFAETSSNGNIAVSSGPSNIVRFSAADNQVRHQHRSVDRQVEGGKPFRVTVVDAAPADNLPSETLAATMRPWSSASEDLSAISDSFLVPSSLHCQPGETEVKPPAVTVAAVQSAQLTINNAMDTIVSVATSDNLIDQRFGWHRNYYADSSRNSRGGRYAQSEMDTGSGSLPPTAKMTKSVTTVSPGKGAAELLGLLPLSTTDNPAGPGNLPLLPPRLKVSTIASSDAPEFVAHLRKRLQAEQQHLQSSQSLMSGNGVARAHSADESLDGENSLDDGGCSVSLADNCSIGGGASLTGSLASTASSRFRILKTSTGVRPAMLAPIPGSAASDILPESTTQEQAERRELLLEQLKRSCYVDPARQVSWQMAGQSSGHTPLKGSNRPRIETDALVRSMNIRASKLLNAYRPWSHVKESEYDYALFQQVLAEQAAAHTLETLNKARAAALKPIDTKLKPALKRGQSTRKGLSAALMSPHKKRSTHDFSLLRDSGSFSEGNFDATGGRKSSHSKSKGNLLAARVSMQRHHSQAKSAFTAALSGSDLAKSERTPSITEPSPAAASSPIEQRKQSLATGPTASLTGTRQPPLQPRELTGEESSGMIVASPATKAIRRRHKKAPMPIVINVVRVSAL